MTFDCAPFIAMPLSCPHHFVPLPPKNNKQTNKQTKNNSVMPLHLPTPLYIYAHPHTDTNTKSEVPRKTGELQNVYETRHITFSQSRCVVLLPTGERDVAQRYLAFAHGAVGRRIDPSWSGPIELFLVPASAPRLV